MRVLVWPATCGTGREAMRALSYLRDVTPLAASTDEGVRVPIVATPGLYDALVEVVAREKIDVVLPCQDEVLRALFNCDRTFRIAMPPMTDVCLSKRLTYRIMADDVRVPHSVPTDIDYPLYVKPDFGYGTRKGGIAYNDSDVSRLASECQPNAIYLEYLPGSEYTIECFSQRGALRWHMARTRENIRDGVSLKTRRVDLDWSETWAKKISEKLAMHGAWYFQVKLTADGEPCLLEVAPRLTSCGLARANGVNLALLTCYAALGNAELIIVDQKCVQVCMRHQVCDYPPSVFRRLFVDLDDTLICRGQVNWQLVALCKKYEQRGYPVAVLTRNPCAAGLMDDEGIPFGNVRILRNGEGKSIFVNRNDVLIDDAFSERCEVHEATGAVCLDVATALEVMG